MRFLAVQVLGEDRGVERRVLGEEGGDLCRVAAEGAVILARTRRSAEPLTFIAEQLGRSRGEAPPGSVQA